MCGPSVFTSRNPLQFTYQPPRLRPWGLVALKGAQPMIVRIDFGFFTPAPSKAARAIETREAIAAVLRALNAWAYSNG